MTALEILKAARELLSEPSHWTKRKLARTASQTPCEPDDVNASCWCADGAIQRVCPPLTFRAPAYDVLCFAASEVYGCEIGFVTYNDRVDTRHEDVLAMFDKAIEIASAS